ncbi:MAG: DUF560 domain-containing protein [Gammaproteobacteria bacterium]|nr:DUF560 domain-containing protein [Gammaproteobacteria bacterium]
MNNAMDRRSHGLLSCMVAAITFGTLHLPAQAEEPKPLDPDEITFKQGMEALEDDRLQTAMKAFQSILTNQSKLHRARLELAVAYYRSLNYAEARKLSQQVLDDPLTPPEVRVTILAFLAQIQKDEAAASVRHEFKPSISVGMMYDSNVNVGPSSDIVTEIPGAILTGTSVETSDNATVLTAGVAHKFQPGKTYLFGERTAGFLWQSQVNLYERNYSSEDEFNLTVLSASTGPAWIVLRHWRANLAFNVDRIWLGGSELAWFNSVNPAVTWQFNDGELTWDATVTDLRYDESSDAGREGTYQATGLSLGKYFNQRKVATQVGARVLDFQAEDDRFGNDGYELLAGLIVKAWPDGTIYGRANYRDVEYDGIEPGFPVARDEEERRYSAGFQHDFRGGNLDKWTLNGDFQFTDNDSNISIYEYDRRQFMLNLGRTF